MKYWRINTDADPEDGDRRNCDLWYTHQMAFAGDCIGNVGNHAGALRRLSPGDGVFMHHSGLGIVGYGIVAEAWDGETYEGVARLLYTDHRKELYEYRIPIRWDPDYDCRKNPLPINGRLPYMGTCCEVKPKKWRVQFLLEELRKQAFST